MKLMVPPLVDMFAKEPAGKVTVSGAPAFVLLNTEIAPPDVTTDELAPRFRNGAINLTALPLLLNVVLSANCMQLQPEALKVTSLTTLRSISPPAPAPIE